MPQPVEEIFERTMEHVIDDPTCGESEPPSLRLTGTHSLVRRGAQGRSVEEPVAMLVPRPAPPPR